MARPPPLNNMNDILQSVGNYSFPAVIALFLMFRVDERLKSLEIAIQSLVTEMRNLNNK
ncbi:YvrJ family protein [Megamonas funiformis]|uniref:YvrJ family protein n=1 Tax=Megamonas funiformis TaxID=437897 RepID=UPI000E3EEF92|nr:YvrJ family protein [Megamonas funiformis]RGJ93366.1 YvrJ family protein [Megamonas funiformis]RGW41566.1 YvrJ family protein [Megamonas funiformis]